MLIPDKKKHLFLFSCSLYASPCFLTHLFPWFRNFSILPNIFCSTSIYTMNRLNLYNIVHISSLSRGVSFYISIWDGNLLLFIFMGCAPSLRLLRSSSVSTRLGLLLIFHVNLNLDKEKDILATVLHYNNKSFSNIVLPGTLHISIVLRREISIFHFL